MESELREAFSIIFGSIAPGYYVLAAIAAIALFFFLRANAADYKVRMAQLEEKMAPIAIAFDIIERRDIYTLLGWLAIGKNGSFEVHWHLRDPGWQLEEVKIGTATSSYDTYVRYDRTRGEFQVWRVGVETGELMARGLYRLGFDEAILSQLPELSAHEKLELRLSMPREFWPKTWLEEG